jgi:hypothetical protein
MTHEPDPPTLFPGEIGTVEIVQHVTDDTLERYAMQTLPRLKIGPLEEHLLVCPEVPSPLTNPCTFTNLST